MSKKYTVNQGCMSRFWSMAAMLGNSVVVFVVVVVRTRPRTIPLAVITMRKSAHGFPFLSHDEYGAPLGGPSGHRSSAINRTNGSWILSEIFRRNYLPERVRETPFSSSRSSINMFPSKTPFLRLNDKIDKLRLLEYFAKNFTFLLLD